MELSLTTATGKASTKSVSVSDAAFDREYNEGLIHQVVTAYLAGGRAGTRAHKSRSEVRGGGTKPWRQKGTGRARSGTIRSPIWRTGGKTFAAKTQDWSQKVNKKMYRAAMQAILSELVRQGRLVIVDSFAVDAPKTKVLVEKLTSLGLGDVMIITAMLDENLLLSSRNLHKVGMGEADNMNPVSLLRHEKVLITVEAVKKLEEIYA